jgi:hypothetical protein
MTFSAIRRFYFVWLLLTRTDQLNLSEDGSRDFEDCCGWPPRLSHTEGAAHWAQPSQPRGPGGLRGEQANRVDTMPVDVLFPSS